ncbi:tetratricopeptide repeat protein [Lentisalinibacter salinarum]|uniref:tetratricopeptide repeat protein n=1 Tax=Lentisalinibacter salinarum TaxID=2992239 RepID=UPI00386DACC9
MIIDELRRRRVFRSVATYVVACWVVIEAADVIFPYLGLPESAVRTVILAAIAGFPLVLVLAWFFDITPEGIVRTPDRSEAAEPPRRLFGRWTDLVLLGLLAVAIAYIVSERLGGGEADRPAGNLGSIAVLPFDDLSPNRDSAYLGDGIAEELLHTLARVEGLRVAARTSSFVFRDTDRSIPEIGEALNVATVLEGSVRKDDSANRVRVTAQLIDARDGFHLWSETYEGPLDDVFRIQDEIAAAIARKLEFTLLGGTAETAAEATESVEAYELYLKGRNAAHERTEEALLRARDYYARATESDPGYALAYTGLADTLSLLIDYGNERLDDVTPRVEELVNRAFELEAELPEAWASLGLLRLQQGQYPAAEEALSRSLSLDPANEDALTWYGSVLLAQDRYRDALSTYLRAYERDPLSIPLNTNLGNLLSTMGRHLQAETHFRRLLELQPAEIGAHHNNLIQSAHARGNMSEAARWAGRELERDPRNLLALYYLVSLHTDLRQPDEARRWLAVMEEMDPEDPYTLQATSLWYVANARYEDNLDYVRATADRYARNLEPYGVTLPPGLLAWLGSANFFAGDLQAARDAYAEALSYDGGVAGPVVNETNQAWLPWMIRTYRQLGLDEEAGGLLEALQAYLEERLSAGIDTASAHAQYAQVLSLRNRPEAALRELRAAAERGFRQAYYLDIAGDLRALLDSAGGGQFRTLLDSYIQTDRAVLATTEPVEHALPTRPQTIDLDAAERERYARRYRREDGAVVKIDDTPEGLVLTVPGDRPRLMRPVSATEFFFEDSAVRLEFVLDERGRLRHMLWHEYGHQVRGRPAVTRREVADYEIDPMVLDDYVGRYEIEGVAGIELRLTRRDNMLFGAITGQAAIPYRPRDVDEFANELVDARLLFRRDRTGRVTGVVIRQDGRELQARRAEVEPASAPPQDAGRTSR